MSEMSIHKPKRSSEIVLENPHLRIVLDSENGSISSVRNKDIGIDLIGKVDSESVPWRLQLAMLHPEIFERRPMGPAGWDQPVGPDKTEIILSYLKNIVGGSWSSDYVSFDWNYDREFKEGTAVNLVWNREDGITLQARVELPDDKFSSYFTMQVFNKGEKTALAIEYPIIDGIQVLGSESSDNYLAHSVDGGFLFKDPSNLFAAKNRKSPDGYPDEPVAHGGLYRIRHYPDGFGSPMQFFAYYKQNVGGFYFAAHDPNNTVKMLNFHSTEGKKGLTSSFVHYSWDWKEGSGIELDYPIVIGALIEGDWYEAAERYRQWATTTGPGHPDWCSLGTLRERVSRGTASEWLIEEVGFNTFGMPISFDVSRWYDAFHKITEKPVFHVPGHDWAAWGGAVLIPSEKWRKFTDIIKQKEEVLSQLAHVLEIKADKSSLESLRELLFKFRPDYWGLFHVEPMEFNPPKYDKSNLSTIKSNGDYFAPFELSDFISFGGDVEEYSCLVTMERIQRPFMCPSTEYWRRSHASLDVGLVEAGADANYYDVSASCAAPLFCLNRKHNHPIGFGRHIVKAYQEIFQTTKEETTKANRGIYVPNGTEVIIENFVGAVDYAQCRAGGRVQGCMEGEEFIEWVKSYQAMKIPLFAYVYHEYGPVLLDGWSNISKEMGEIFYDIAARVALEGGLLQLNYEFTPLELFPGMQGSSYQLVYTNQIKEERNPYRVDLGKLRFIREIAEARTVFAKDYLAYGKMIKPLKILSEVPSITLDWFHYNSIHRLRIGQRGEYTTDSVVQVGWCYKDIKLGFLFVNLFAETSQTISLEIDPSQYNLKSDRYSAKLRMSGKDEDLGSFQKKKRFGITLPPRKVVLFEIRKQS